MLIKFKHFIGTLALVFPLLGGWSAGEVKSVQIPERLPECPVRFIRGTLVAGDGAIWAVGERESVYRLQVGDRAYEKSWLNMDYYSGFPKGKNFTCIAEDRQGRIWVGTDDSGVAVFNGREWKTYDRGNALNGEHVYALAVSPVSGEVAVATSGGVSVYDPGNDSWKALDRSTGLAEDQAASVGFDSRGNLWLAYACGGVSCSPRKSGYMQWKNVQAPWYWDSKQFARQPYQPYGDGLPSNICNVLACTEKDQVLVGTWSGLAYSNGISSWRFLRGRDYARKNSNLYGSAARKTAVPGEGNAKMLSEDFVSSILRQGKDIFIGYRTQGVDVLDAERMTVRQRIRKGLENTDVPSLLALKDGSVWAATYGKGLVSLKKGSLSYQLDRKQQDDEIPFPSPARMEDPAAVLKRLEKLGADAHAGKSIVFRGEDWSTKGDWCGRYGLTRATLCATNAPMSNSEFKAKTVSFRTLSSVPGYPGYQGAVSSYWIQGLMGLNRNKGDALRWWVHSIKENDNRNILFDPTDSVRTEAEWDDHGEVYPGFVDGPDIWTVVEVPEGVHEIALYFYNPNGYLSNESRRDYVVEARRHPSTSSLVFQFNNVGDLAIGEQNKWGKILTAAMEQWYSFPVEARTRVSRFAGSGVYKRFMCRKGGIYLFRVCRNGSFNTILNGVFVNEKIPWEIRMPEELPYYVAGQLAGIVPTPERVNGATLGQREKAVCKPLYELQYTRKYLTPAACSLQNRYILSLWRQARENRAEGGCLADCLQWEARVSDDRVRASFDETMKRSWDQSQIYYIGNRSRDFMPNAPGTVPFSPRELRLMAKLRIDWRQYRDDAKNPPEKTVQEMKEFLKKELLKQQQTRKQQ
ncbi:ligand-binding sensor domain-containing protein [Akkermansia massiliensis]|uniref:ligand-binding sensor domain-containing protein n=1 Tax=Akkermansia massiliensis TaxID=2927224 RepID=UPI00202F88EC|nr:two-component regulator propeller domain-containing protein [Akkermansia sp. B2-R-115]